MQFTHYILLISFLLVHPITTVHSTTSPNPKTLDDFIKKSCQVTLYRDLCYSSLSSSYTGAPDLRKLTNTAIRISLDEAVHAANYVAAVSDKTPTRTNAALGDCIELTEDAAQQIRKSLDQIMGRNLSRFDISNVQTRMSAAITNQQTCIDGFNDVRGGKDGEEVENEVTRKVGMVMKLISNALALVNSLVDDAIH